MRRMAVLDDEMWGQIEAGMPPVKGPMGRPMRDHRLLLEGAIYRSRTGSCGVISRRSSARGRRSASAITGSRPMGLGTRSPSPTADQLLRRLRGVRPR
jgi:transposase